MKKVSIWGVLIGGIVDVIATNILAFPLVVYMVLTQIDFIGMNQQEMTTAFTQAVQGDRMLFILQLMIGSFCSILGGYTAALIAKCNELLNGALSAYLSVAIGINSIVSGQAVESTALAVLGFILSPALGLFGGYLRHFQIRLKQQRSKQIAIA